MNTNMDLWVPKAVPYAADYFKDAILQLLANKKKSQDALVIPEEISRGQWPCISIIILASFVEPLLFLHNATPMALPF